MVEYFKPFLRDILTLGLSRTTLRRHRDNIWVLGGEVIRRLQMDSRLRRVPVEQVVLDLTGEDGGPLLSHHESEAEQRAFDATCRKLFRFLTEPRSAAATSSEPPAPLKGTIADRPATSVTVKPHSRAPVRRRRRA